MSCAVRVEFLGDPMAACVLAVEVFDRFGVRSVDEQPGEVPVLLRLPVGTEHELAVADVLG